MIFIFYPGGHPPPLTIAFCIIYIPDIGLVNKLLIIAKDRKIFGRENGLTLYINMLLTISELNLPDSGSVVLNQGCIISGKSYFNVQQRLNISKLCNTLMNVINWWKENNQFSHCLRVLSLKWFFVLWDSPQFNRKIILIRGSKYLALLSLCLLFISLTKQGLLACLK